MTMHKDRIALVTGAGRGIGRAIALELASAGATVMAIDLPDDQGGCRADETAHQIVEAGGKAKAFSTDVGDRTQVEQLFGDIVGEFGRLDIAVANAAFHVKRLLVDTDWETIQRIINVSMYGVLHIAQLASKQMIAQPSIEGSWLGKDLCGGKIVLIGSIHAEMAIPFHSVYGMAKAAGNQLCRTLAAELARYRINVNAINPGWIDTPGERTFIDEETLQAAAKELPWKRLGTPEEIAGLALFLTSPAATYMTGEILAMDGGLRRDQSSITTGLE